MFDVCGNSVCGPARHNNEDYYAYRNAPDHAVLAIADGLGGCPYGEVASRIAVEASMEYLDGALADISGVDDLSFELDKAFNKANIEILRNCAENPDYIGMCSTLTVAFVAKDQLTIAHYGDCRAYLVRNGDILQLTEDHNLTGFLLRSGKISEEEAQTHEGRSSLVNCLGENKYIRPDIYTYNAFCGDCVILASDGMYSLFDEDTCRDILQNTDDLEEMCGMLVTRGGSEESKDNSTVVVCKILPETYEDT